MYKFLTAGWCYRGWTPEYYQHMFDIGLNCAIDVPGAADILPDGMMILMHTGCYPDPTDGACGYHWGKPITVGSGGVYGNIEYWEWLYQKYGNNPNVIGLLGNDACLMCDDVYKAGVWLDCVHKDWILWQANRDLCKQPPSMPASSSLMCEFAGGQKLPQDMKQFLYTKMCFFYARKSDGLEWWPLIPTNGCNTAELRYQIHCAVAHGATSIFYFPYMPHRSNIMDTVETDNKYLQSIGDTLKKLVFVGTQINKDNANSIHNACPLDELKEMSANCFVGLFEDEYAYVVNNNLTTESEVIELEFNNGFKGRYILMAGQGLLIKYSND